MKQLCGKAAIGEDADVVVRVEGIPPGRYQFRVQGFCANGKYGAFSPMSKNNCLVPAENVRIRCLKILESAMIQHNCRCITTKCRCHTPEINKCVELALDSGAEEDDPIIVQAQDLLGVLNRQQVRPYEVDKNCQASLKNLKKESLLRYRPRLEKALWQAHSSGIPEDADEVQAALKLLTSLRKKELQKKKTWADRQKAVDDALGLINRQLELNFRIGIMQALDMAKAAGVADKHPIVMMAKRRAAMLEPKKDKSDAQDAADTELSFEVVKAAIASKEKLLKSVIHLKGSPNSFDQDGRSAVLIAASNCYLPCIKVLVESKAYVNRADSHGNTPLMASLLNHRNYDPLIAKILLEADCSPGQYNVFGRSPLHEAAAAHNDVVVELLLDFRAKPDAIDNMGVQPLFLAKAGGSSDKKQIPKKQERTLELITAALTKQDQDDYDAVDDKNQDDEDEASTPENSEKSDEEKGSEGSVDGFNAGMDDDQLSVKSMITTAATTPDRGTTPTPGAKNA